MGLILGIDPGSRITGFGLVEAQRQGQRYISSGTIRPDGDAFPKRLAQIFTGLTSIIERHQPDVVAVESAFMSRNADSALKLGQARGVAIAAAARFDLQVVEYTPRAVKQSVVGNGGADKAQVQGMICRLLGLQGTLGADAADALAIAMCHAHHDRVSSFHQHAMG